MGLVEEFSRKLETKTPEEILVWGWETFGPGVIASSSFQTQSVALLHMISLCCPDMPIVFTDTGYHFPETLAFRDELQRRFRLKVHNAYPDLQSRRHLEIAHEPLYLSDPDLCCRIHKVEPMARVLADKRAWVTGLRRDQTETRKRIQPVERRPDGLIKVNPLANWTHRDLWTYLQHHDLPSHPLLWKGYRSIGCAPCTRPVSTGDDERAGRWAGTDKTECGLHTMADPEDRMSAPELLGV